MQNRYQFRAPSAIMKVVNDFAKIHTGERLQVGCRGDPVAEFTRFGWTIMSPGADSGLSPALLAVNSNADYEKLCALDVLGLADSATRDQNAVSSFSRRMIRNWAPLEGKLSTLTKQQGRKFAQIKHSCTEAEED